VKIIEQFENELLSDISDVSGVNTDLLTDVIDGKCSPEELVDLADHIEKRFFDIEIWRRCSVLFLLSKINSERAYIVARKDLENVYHKTRACTAYLGQVITSIDSFEHFICSLGAMEIEKTLRIAYALVNKLEISDGDFQPPLQRK
jgi:hypothetical protein